MRRTRSRLVKQFDGVICSRHMSIKWRWRSRSSRSLTNTIFPLAQHTRRSIPRPIRCIDGTFACKRRWWAHVILRAAFSVLLP
mgnify:FL=1